jgi:hypothetical protein
MNYKSHQVHRIDTTSSPAPSSKLRQYNHSSTGGTICRTINEFLAGVLLMLCSSRPKDSMCKYYGHVTQRGNFDPNNLVCTDCGAKIKSAKELRRASLNCQST